MQIIQVLLCFLSKLFNIIAKMMTVPPRNTLIGGISLRNSHTHSGPQSVSINIKRPTVAEGVVLDPIVIQINPVSYTHLTLPTICSV